jgi:hypothetical protein
MADILRCEVRSERRMRTEVTCRRHKTYSTSRLPQHMRGPSAIGYICKALYSEVVQHSRLLKSIT